MAFRAAARLLAKPTQPDEKNRIAPLLRGSNSLPIEGSDLIATTGDSGCVSGSHPSAWFQLESPLHEYVPRHAYPDT